MLDLSVPMVQLIKTGTSKPALRVDAIYSCLLVSKIAAVHIKASELHNPGRCCLHCCLW